MRNLRHLFCPVICLLIWSSAFAASRPKTLAVVDFRNASGDRSLDPWGIGIAEDLSTDLAGVRGINLLERRELQELLKELKFNQSQYVDSAAAQKIGKQLGADYLVVGAYQKFQDALRMNARVVEVETGRDLVGTKAEGKDLFRLEDQLAESLRRGLTSGLAEEEDSPVTPSTTSFDAFQSFSEGVGFFRNELFAARRGCGAFCNDVPLHVSNTEAIGASLLATGFPYDIQTSEQNNLDNFCAFALRTQGVRRCGSAALDLCYVAAGRFDGFWELKLNPWDCAAGYLIVSEAGGTVTNFRGEPASIYGKEVVASNGRIHQQMLAVLEATANDGKDN